MRGMARPRACKSPKTTQGDAAASAPLALVMRRPGGRGRDAPACRSPGCASVPASAPIPLAAPWPPPGDVCPIERAWRCTRDELLPTMCACSVEGLPRRCVGQADAPVSQARRAPALPINRPGRCAALPQWGGPGCRSCPRQCRGRACTWPAAQRWPGPFRLTGLLCIARPDAPVSRAAQTPPICRGPTPALRWGAAGPLQHLLLPSPLGLAVKIEADPGQPLPRRQCAPAPLSEDALPPAHTQPIE